MKRLRLYRYASGIDDTLGLLFDMSDGWPEFLCYTLEDEHREEKVYGETCIPAGTYQILLRTEGGFHQRYSSRFAGIHRGMLWLQGVPGFDHILLHVGNDDDDTAGCILVGDRATSNVTKDGTVGASVQAYRRIYDPVATAIASGMTAEIQVVDGHRERIRRGHGR